MGEGTIGKRHSAVVFPDLRSPPLGDDASFVEIFDQLPELSSSRYRLNMCRTVSASTLLTTSFLSLASLSERNGAPGPTGPSTWLCTCPRTFGTFRPQPRSLDDRCVGMRGGCEVIRQIYGYWVLFRPRFPGLKEEDI
jgi:hypothetical protein